MVGRVLVAMSCVLFGAATLAACSKLPQELKECQSSGPAESVVACSAVLKRGDQVSASDIEIALRHRALAYESLCKLPAALADHREKARLFSQEAPIGNIQQLENEIAANARSAGAPATNVTPPSVAAPQPARLDAVTWSCIVKWDEPDIKLFESFLAEVPQSVHRQDAQDRIKKRKEKAEENQAQRDAKNLLLTVGGTALGGVILVALLMQGWPSFAVPAFFGLLAGIMVTPALNRFIVQPIFPITVTSILLGIGAALAARVIAEFFLEKLLSEIREDARQTLVPERWTSPQGLVTVSIRDHVKRWFVAISAATGSIVGAVLGLHGFWNALYDTVHDLEKIVLATILVGIAMFLTGPMQAYVFDVGARADHPSDPSKKISDLFANGFDWRAAGRFGLVFLACVQISLLSSCVSSTIKGGNARTVTLIFAVASAPAIVSYYWSAALQRGVASVRDATFKPSLYAGAAMAYGAGLLVVFAYFIDFSYTPGQDKKQDLFFFFFSPAVAMFPALAIGALTTLVHAVAGATAIDLFPRKYTMVFIPVALVIAATIQVIVITQAQGLGLLGNIGLLYPTFIGSIIGWIVGLWASGFPRLLTDKAAQGGPAH
jgi:hypothetical protein